MIIGHYEHQIWARGGIATYIRNIAIAQKLSGDQVYYFSKLPCSEVPDGVNAPVLVENESALYAQVKRLNIELLHLHSVVQTPPPQDLPTVRTVHVHEPYCPSGSRYLERWGKPCDRSYSLTGCIWGHLADRCGSIRPQKLNQNFQRVTHEKAVLQTLPVVTVSRFMQGEMIRSGYLPESVQSIHLFGPETKSTSLPPISGTPRFLFMGRITPQKGLSWLLKSVAQITTPIHLDIAGEGDEEPKMKRLAEQLGISSKVTFHGWLNSEEISRLIIAARAIIFPSVWHEPAGLVALEAMAYSRPVIASQVGGIPEMVRHQINGLLVSPNHINDLAAAIQGLAIDQQLAARLGITGNHILDQEFTAAIHIEKLNTVYKNALRKVYAISANN